MAQTPPSMWKNAARWNGGSVMTEIPIPCREALANQIALFLRLSFKANTLSPFPTLESDF